MTTRLRFLVTPVNTLPQRESITNIRRSPGAVEPALAGPVAHTAQQGNIGEPGTACKPAPQQLGLVEAALQLMVAVAGHPRYEVDVRAGGGGERRRGPPHHVVGQRAQGAELAGGDQRLGRPLVGEGGGGRAEREVAAAALGAAATGAVTQSGRRPRAGGAATRAMLRRQRAEVAGARLAEPAAGRSAPVSYTHLRAHETRHDLV